MWLEWVSWSCKRVRERVRAEPRVGTAWRMKGENYLWKIAKPPYDAPASSLPQPSALSGALSNHSSNASAATPLAHESKETTLTEDSVRGGERPLGCKGGRKEYAVHRSSSAKSPRGERCRRAAEVTGSSGPHICEREQAESRDAFYTGCFPTGQRLGKRSRLCRAEKSRGVGQVAGDVWRWYRVVPRASAGCRAAGTLDTGREAVGKRMNVEDGSSSSSLGESGRIKLPGSTGVRI